MVELDRALPEPPELTAFRAAHPNARPTDFDAPAFAPVKRIVKRQRNAEQSELCVYCEQVLAPVVGHVEHIKPKGGPHAHPELTFAHHNLAHSCDGIINGVSNHHCGPTKGHRVLSNEPGPGCNSCFDIMTDGGIMPVITIQPRAARAALRVDTEILRLNHPTLKQERESWLKQVLALMQTDPSAVTAFLADKPFRYILKRL